MSGHLARSYGMDEQPDDTNPLVITAAFMVGVVVVAAVVYGFAWLMWAGN